MKRPAAVTRLGDLYDRLRTSFWFLPGIYLGAGIILAEGMLVLDRITPPETMRRLPGIGVGSIDSARLILSTLAGSLITITALVFSLTIVALSLASSQFGPRLLRSFMRDRGTQSGLGVFSGTFLYCLLVLYGAEGRASGGNLPHLGVAMAIALGVISMGVLIYFIHNVSTSIHVNEVVAVVSRELRAQIDRLFPEDGEEEALEDETDQRPAASASAPLRSHHDGYLRIVDEGHLVELARKAEVEIDLLVRPGSFVLETMPLATISGRETLDEEFERDLLGAFGLGSQRTAVQDLGFNVEQLVELALRALSPGINDPRTAITCVHRLGQNLAILARRPFPSRLVRDDDHRVRLRLLPLRYADLLEQAFGRIWDIAQGSMGVRDAIREICRLMAELCAGTKRHDAIVNFARLRLGEG